MSLRPDDRSRGSERSRSWTRERSRSRDARAPSPSPSKSSSTKETRKKSARFADEDDKPSKTKSKNKSVSFGEDDALKYESRQPSSVTPGLSSLPSGLPPLNAGGGPDDDEDEDEEEAALRAKVKRSSSGSKYANDVRSSSGLEMPMSPTIPEDGPKAFSRSYTAPTGVPQYPMDDAMPYMRMPTANYTVPDQYQYAQTSQNLQYSSQPQYPGGPASSPEHGAGPGAHPQRMYSTSGVSHSQTPHAQIPYSPARAYSFPARSDPHEETVTGAANDISSRAATVGSSSNDGTRGRSNRLSTGEAKLDPRAPSPSGLKPKLDRLSVSGGQGNGAAPGALPPASPLLEAYKGTYQQMPSPMMRPLDNDDIDDIPALDGAPSGETLQLSRSRSKSDAKSTAATAGLSGKKRVTIYDGEADADTLANAMSHSVARPGPLINILPDLTHDQLLELREQYKKRCKVQGRGVNIAKHIKMKTTGNFGKACYVTALGRWESEAYWANFWYQSRSSSRELLIEALMGRNNADVREIKDSFRDKRYDDSLSRCMEKELKPDKFRTAVLMALEGRRQEETDTWPIEYRNQDVEVLDRALRGREGGESAILGIVIRRSDNHLREVLRTFEKMNGYNFAKEALKRSNNLVGEVIAHILNGCINRPARDALLLKHALEDITSHNRAVEFRYELLMSRLIRLHWDKIHLAKVKEDFRRKYGGTLEEEVGVATKGEFGDFCQRLCET